MRTLRTAARVTRIVTLLSLIVLTGACDKSPAASAGNSAAQSGKKLRIVTTTTMIADLARQIGGDHVEVQAIMGPGVDPHTYKPSTGDLGAVSQAELVLYNGLHLEGTMVELFEHRLKETSFAIVSGIDTSELLSWDQGQSGVSDPHIWFDCTLWAKAAKAVGDRLAKQDPAHASLYQSRAQEVVAKLTELDTYVMSKVESIPKDKRVLITSHDAYNYFGRRYGIQVRGLQGISTESEAGIASVNSAVDFILLHKIPAIFVESSVSHKTIERVQADCKARGFDVQIGGELFSDALGAPGQHPGYDVHTYGGMVKYNIDTIAKALQ